MEQAVKIKYIVAQVNSFLALGKYFEIKVGYQWHKAFEKSGNPQ
jgi:hypothetical protein